MTKTTILRIGLFIGAISAGGASATEIGPTSELGFSEAPPQIELKLVRLFPPRGGGIVGRFKLTNGGREVIAVNGRRQVADVITLEPLMDGKSYVAFHRPRENANAEWRSSAQTAGSTGAPNEWIEISPGQIQYLDITLPNSPASDGDEWLVQVVVVISGRNNIVSSPPFTISGDDIY